MVEVCDHCHGAWFDRGKLLEFSDAPSELERQLDHGLDGARPAAVACPRCQGELRTGRLPGGDVPAEQCPECGGVWIEGEARRRAAEAPRGRLDLLLPEERPDVAEADPHARAAAEERSRLLSAGLLALPNLFLRSALVLFVLYALLGLLLITLVQFGLLRPSLAVVIGVGFALLQFLIGPWCMDLVLRFAYSFRWVTPHELPEHLRSFVERVCEQHRMRFPSFGLIDDGAPQAFTYGHHPGNARVVISRGILELLEPDEVEAVVAHELGHARNWDMALMTLANLVPLLAYYLYRVAIEIREEKARAPAWMVAVGSYVVYIISEYLVLWFSRTREYYADRFAGQATGKPNALASALVKIAYGLAAAGRAEHEAVAAVTDKKAKIAGQDKIARQHDRMGALRAMNIFDDRAAVGLVVSSAVGRGDDAKRPEAEALKGAMQWDLWNPWAAWYELNSTHPLVAKRLLRLGDQAAQQGQEPLVIFDRRKPESYWDDFLVDVAVMALPLVCFLAGLVAFMIAGLTAQRWHPSWLGGGLVLAGLASLFKTWFVYRSDFFPHLSVAALLHKVKVSAVRPVPATLTGTIIGKGVPGLVWSEDFVMRDRTGILFLDYNQPLAIWNFLFGLFRAGRYQGKDIRVSGWFRRAPVPYLEVNRVEVLDGSLPPRRCYARHARMLVACLLVAAGVAVAILPLLR
jgi:Zn-dependent protease with chaperone function/Zn-finger nucleic acid-binding protein